MSTFGAVDLSAPVPGTPSGGGADQAVAGTVPGPLVVDVDATNLQEVAERSLQVPVVVVLHTPRSQPSQDLAALLERLATELEGRFELARVDVDAAPEVAQALQASAVPTVMALVAGQPVPIFQGSADEAQVRQVLDQLLQLASANGVTGRVAVGERASEPAEPEETETERAAREAIERGDYAAAEEIYNHAIAQSPADDTLKVARAQVRMLARMDGQDPAVLLAAADAPGADLDAVLAGADAALAVGDVNAALGRALEAVRSHSEEEREKARLRLLELFDVIGSGTPEVSRARRQLAVLLF